jgi:hypothetical protein
MIKAMDFDDVVDLDAQSDWSFADLRRPAVPAELHSADWQEQRRAARRAADAARAVARRQAVQRNVDEARKRIAERRSHTRAAAGANVGKPPPGPSVRGAGRSVPGPPHPQPPSGALVRYARLSEGTVVVITLSRLLFDWCPVYSVWVCSEDRWTRCGDHYGRAAALAAAQDAANCLLAGAA